MKKLSVLLSATMLCFASSVSMAAASPGGLPPGQQCQKDRDCPLNGSYCNKTLLPPKCVKCVTKDNLCDTQNHTQKPCCPLFHCKGPKGKATCQPW